MYKIQSILKQKNKFYIKVENRLSQVLSYVQMLACYNKENVLEKRMYDRMDKQRGMKYALPLAAVVAVSSMMLLNSNYTSVPTTNRILIAAGATLVTYILSFILFGIKDKQFKIYQSLIFEIESSLKSKNASVHKNERGIFYGLNKSNHPLYLNQAIIEIAMPNIANKIMKYP